MAGATECPLPSGTLTFLFTDLEGSTRLLHALGDRYVRLLEDMRRLLRQPCAERGGIEFGTEGDALFVAFPRAADAVEAAVSAQRAMHEHAWEDGTAARVRIALHTGDVTVVDGDYVGMALHVTARVCSAAHGGQVLLTETTRQLAGDPPTVDLGEHRLRDIPDPMRLHQATAEGLPADFPPLRTLTALPNNLPAATDELIGRSVEVIDAAEALRESRLVTLTGAGGAGKTRLATEVARAVLPEWPDGVWLVELAAADVGTQVAALAAGVLRVAEQPDEALVDTITERLRHRQVLLVLDNCEHLVDAVAAFADAVLRSCEGVRILATSRELLGVRGERAMRVAPLPVDTPDGGAVALFAARAREAVPGFDADVTDPVLLTEVCRRLDGLPLAIELAAARLRALSLPQLAARLDDRFRLLTGGSRTDMARQRTLEAVVAWSYDLLPEMEQQVFRQLAVFPDSFDLEAAEAVAAGEDVEDVDVLDAITRLVEKSLILAVEQPGGYRYQLLETLRQYGRERVIDLDEAAAVRARLLAWAVGRAGLVADVLRTPQQDAALAEVLHDRANLRAALDWAVETGDGGAALWIATMVPAMLNSERRALLRRLLRDTRDVNSTLRGHACCALSNMAFEQGDFDEAEVTAKEAAAAYEEAGEERLAAWALYFLASAWWGAGEVQRAQQALAEVAAVFRRLGDGLGLAYALWSGSQCRPDVEAAIADADEAVRRFRELESPIGLAHAVEGRALLNLRRAAGDVAPGILEALELFMAAGNVGCAAHSLEAAAACLAVHGEVEEAAALVGAAASARRESGHGHRPWELEAIARVEEVLDGAAQPEVLDRARAEGAGLTIGAATDRAGTALHRLSADVAGLAPGQTGPRT